MPVITEMIRDLFRNPVRFGVALYTFALVVRLVYVSIGYDVPPQDTRDYDDIAMNLLAGKGFVATENWFGFEVRSWRAPFYPVFLAAVYGFLGYSHEAVRIAQCFVGAGTVLLVWLLARQLAQRYAIVAGLIAAVYGPHVAVGNEVMTETWFCFWQVLAVYCLIRSGGRSANRLWWVVGGVSIGFAALTRPVGLILLAAYGIYELVRSRSAGLRPVLFVVGATVLTLLPWTIRNYAVHGSWPTLSTHGGFILYRSNDADPDWRKSDGWQIDREAFELTTEIGRDRDWFRQGVAEVVSNPVRTARWTVEKFVRFWYMFRPDYNLWYMLLLPFFVVGAFQFGRENGYGLMSLLILVSVAVFSTALYGSTRFRLPLEPLFLLYATAWGADFCARAGSRMTVHLFASWTAINLLIEFNEASVRSAVLSILGVAGIK